MKLAPKREKDILELALTAAPSCKLCKSKVKWKIIRQKTQYKSIGKHFCTWANGNCTLTLTHYRKKKSND